jgi:RIO-like serine/threonine protein kinase
MERKKIVCKSEYMFHKLLSSQYSFIPKFINYDEVNCELTMQNIDSLCISDMYGEKFTDIPESIREEVRDIIKTLYEDGFCYPDITGYNFIEDTNGKVWIIDFEHCFWRRSQKVITNKEKHHIQFIKAFISGEIQSWNPEFL